MRFEGPRIDPNFITPKPNPGILYAENACLGCILINEKALHVVSEVLGDNPEVFYFPYNRQVWQIYHRLWAKTQAIDVVCVIEELRKDTSPEPSEGWPIYVTSLMEAVSTSHHARTYAEKVLERYRALEGLSLTRRVASSKLPEPELLPMAEKIIELHKGDERKRITGMGHTAVVLDQMEAMLRGETGAHVPTGYTKLDKTLRGGVRNGEMIVVAARPSQGKTAFALNLALGFSRKPGTRVLLFSLEMSNDSIIERLISIVGNVRIARIADGFLANQEMAKAKVAGAALSKMPIDICDEANMDIPRIVHRAIAYAQAHTSGVIVIDYLQLIGSGQKMNSREAEVSYVSKQLKNLARVTGWPVVVCCQLNRESESQPDPFKRMAYLRESGSIEQDADVVMVLGRPEEKKGETIESDSFYACVCKHRNGPTGLTELRFERETQRIESIGVGKTLDEEDYDEAF